MLDTIIRALDERAKVPPVWWWLRDVASVLGVTSAVGASLERTVKHHDRQVADAQDVAQMSQGDRAGLAALYDRYSAILLGLGMRILGDRRESEDVVHDVFIEAWGAAASYDPTRGRVSTWLVLRMRSRALDRVRARGRVTVTEDPIDEASSAQAPNAHALVAEGVAVRSALAELPLEQRRALELGYFAGMSSSEIAAETGVSIGTVKSRVAAGLSKLRERLGGAP